MKTAWNAARLSRLFARYNLLYWNSRLHSCEIGIKHLNNYLGIYYSKKRQIAIDVDNHRTDREIRATLLHEMAHAAAGSKGLAHGYAFWEQIERLLRQKALIDVTSSEAPHLGNYANAVPKRFSLARDVMKKLEAKRNRALLKQNVSGEFLIDQNYLIGRFEDAAMKLTWRQALLLIGSECGLLDVGGKPKDKWTARTLLKCKAKFLRKRRFWVRMRKNYPGHV
jgi:hypothetical protein